MACADRNSLLREGTEQGGRFLKALSPDFARVDERNLRELLLFVQRYAAHVTYFDADNHAAGTWEPLISRDLSIALATLATIDPTAFTDYYKALVKRIRLAIKAADTDEAKRCFKYLFDLVYALAKTVDEQCARLVDDPSYQRDMADIIAFKIDKAVRALLTFRNVHQPLLPTADATDPEAPFATLNSSIATHQFHYIGDTPEPLNLTIPDTDDLSKINFIVHHNLFQQQVKAVFSGTALAIRKANQLFSKSIETNSRHQPHIALMQAFLQLFGHAQHQLNQYGKNHLEYYYGDILQLKPRKPQPDRTHLVFDLHRHVDNHLLKSGTLFNGGKDNDGNLRFYRLTQDAVLNQAKVAQVHSLRKANGTLYLSEHSNQAPVFLFGDSPTASSSVGFAIVSNLFFLKSGERTITIAIRFTPPIARNWDRLRNLRFNTRLTGEKGWLEDQVHATYHPENKELTFSIAIDGGKEAIQAYDEKTHLKAMQVSLPLLMVCFDQEASGMDYDLLAEQAIDTIRVSVEVQAHKVATLSNDVGSLDGSKPFKPFGDLPRRGSGFYIGSDELFLKPLTSLALTTDLPPEFSASYLFRGEWRPLSKTGTSGGYTLNMPNYPIQERTTPTASGHGYGTGDRDGYIRLSLTSDRYSLSAFMDSLTQSFNETKLMKIPLVEPIRIAEADKKSASKKAGATVAADVKASPTEVPHTAVTADQFEGFRMVRSSTPTPKDLTVDTFEINYSASDTITFEHGENQAFFHLYPFGHKQIHQGDRRGLLPAISYRGELFIGLAGVQSPKTVSLLFEVVEGSSNPLKPVEAVHWLYLADNNEWNALENAALIDGSRGLTRTGVVTVFFPSDASSTSTVMPPGMLWLKVAVQDQLDAVCKLTSIRAQAGLVELVHDETSGRYFTEMLPRGTISKLMVSDAAVKRIEQPMDSFGGQTKEQPDHFYTRVSERLRHKQRAVTMWDYERLVLEQFPSIYKVKCINRAGFIEHNGTATFCENYPGHVTLVTIPDLSRSSHANLLRPYTPIGTLRDIIGYLESLCSPFVTLHVRNPQFEEIQLEFAVNFHPQLDRAYHLNLLNDDIERFLCPWAFDTAKQLTFGGVIHKSALIDFIDELPYVHVVSAFKMHHLIRDEQQAIQTANYDVESVTASSSRSVLVSYADGAVRHLIHVAPNCECV